MEPKDELDVSAMFQKMGSKLGWFQYKDLDSALHTLSNSTKKKSNKSRRRQESSEDALSKSSHNEKKNMKTRKRKEMGKTKLSFSSESPLKDIKGNSLEDNVPLSDCRDDFQIPLRRTPGATDLTRKSQKSKNDKENKDQNPVFEKDEKMKQSSENSNILQNSVETNTNDQSYHKNCNSSPESDFLDLGVPVQESTRIHSRASIDTMLDIPDVSLGLFQQENLSDQIYSSKNHSYKDLNIIKSGKKRVSIGHFQQIIYREQTENNTNLCSKLQNLDLSNNSEEEPASTSNQTDLYTTAMSKKFIEVHNTKGLNSIEKSRKSVYFDARTGDSSSSSSSFTELSPPDNKQFISFNSSNSSSNNHNKRSDSEEHSSFEVADISIQTSRNISRSKLEKIQKNESGCSGSDSSDFVEVHDVSLQTSINDNCSSKKYDENSSERNSSGQDSNTSCSFVEVQDISSQVDVKSSDDIPERSLPSQDKSGSLSSRTNSKNKTIFFDAESDFEEISINDEKVALKDKQETSRNIISSGSYNFSSDDDSENNCQEKPKKHQSVGSIFSSDEEEELVKITNINNEKVRKSKDCREQEQVSCHVDNKSELTNEKSAHSQEQQGSKIDDILSDSEDECFKNAVENESQTNWRSKKKYESDSCSDDQLEDFFQKMKGKKPEPVTKEEESDDSMGSFIVDDFEVTSSEDNSDEEYLPDVLNDSSDESDDDLYTTSLPDPAKKSKKVNSIEILSSDTDEELPTIEKPKPKRQPIKTPKRADVFKTPKREDVFKTPKREDVFKTPKKEDVSSKINRGIIPVKKFSFLKSLSSSIPVELRDPDALRYVNGFAKTKEDLTAKLFKFYNETVFDCKLPTNLNIIWNKRLLKTAGYCVNKTNREAVKTCQIELSIKVCDSAERTRDTLIHELCHAAVWVLNGVKDGHGPYWKYWASKANKVHPEIAVVTRCHSYKIQTKYKYQCVDCKYEVGRHSKSLDTKRFVCGKCKGAFVLLDKSGKPANQATNKDGTAKTPNKFALFVKENYKEIKKRDKSMKHGEVMSVLSKEFAKQKLS